MKKKLMSLLLLVTGNDFYHSSYRSGQIQLRLLLMELRLLLVKLIRLLI